MSKRKKDWRHRVTPQELAERRFMDEQVDKIVVNAHSKAIHATLDAHRGSRMEEATAWLNDFAPKMCEIFIHGMEGAIKGFVSEESMKKIFGDQYMPLGARGAIVGDTFLLPPEAPDASAFHTAALAQAEINKHGHER